MVSGTAQATQKILAAAEEIDQAADSLSAALKGRIEQGAAQDIRDLVIRIFEACNFQDLIGQRITKVMATLKPIEDQLMSPSPKSTRCSKTRDRDQTFPSGRRSAAKHTRATAANAATNVNPIASDERSAT